MGLTGAPESTCPARWANGARRAGDADLRPCTASLTERTHLGPLLAASALLAALIGGCGGGSGDPEATGLASEPEPFDREAPNIVVVMTDDQAADTMVAMPKTQRLLGATGTTFTRGTVSFPLCCPSRAAFLTGQYAHNNGVKDNGPPDGGIGALDQRRTLPVWLREAGYETTFVGKYLNGYGKQKNGGPELVPPGWVRWYGLVSNDKTSAFDYTVNENGELAHYGNAKDDYKTDVMARLARKAVRKTAPGPRPFFLWVATSAPHTDNGLPPNAPRTPLPAPRHRGGYERAEPPRGTSFDEDDVSDKPRWIRKLPRLTPRKRAAIRRLYVSQLESLGAVDDLVAGLAAQLRRRGELDRTLFVFTSDNGFIRGRHRIRSGKSLIYEEAINVPLLIAGPGVPQGEIYREPVANVDLAPTLLRAAGVKPPGKLDGVPLQPVLAGEQQRPPILLEIFGRKDGDVFGIRTGNYVYAEHADGFVELYNLATDPLQLENAAKDPSQAGVRTRLATELERLRSCAGASCQR